MKAIKTLKLIAIFALCCVSFAIAGVSYAANCTTGTIDSNQQGMTIIVNCPTSVRLIGVPADNTALAIF